MNMNIVPPEPSLASYWPRYIKFQWRFPSQISGFKKETGIIYVEKTIEGQNEK